MGCKIEAVITVSLSFLRFHVNKQSIRCYTDCEICVTGCLIVNKSKSRLDKCISLTSGSGYATADSAPFLESGVLRRKAQISTDYCKIRHSAFNSKTCQDYVLIK